MPTTPNFETFAKPVKDVFYVTVGLGVKGYEAVKSNRGDLCGWLESRAADGKVQFDTQATQIEERVDKLLATVQANLPEQAADLVKQASDAAKAARDQIKDLVNRNGQAAAA